jgi:hypothetical protein
MAVAVFAETFESLERRVRRIPKSRSRTADDTGRAAVVRRVPVVRVAAAARGVIAVRSPRHSDTAAAASSVAVQLVGYSPRKKKWAATASTVIHLKCQRI